MNDEPNETHPFDEPMDTSLLQLERELFSLSPAAPSRSLVNHLDRQMAGTVVPVARNDIPGNVVPFRWRRIVVPAAAAVVVVSVLNRLEGPPPGNQTLVSQPGQRVGVPGTVPMEQATGYMLKAEPVYVIPSGWEAVEHQYWIQSGNQPALGLPSRATSGTVPVSFH